jgi:aromatic ring hydroxylase
MPARSGESYLKGLRSSERELWFGGERIEDASEHPATRPGADAIAAYFDLQLARPDVLLRPDPETGEAINISHLVPRNLDELRQRGQGFREIAELSVGTMGRTPDYMNCTFAGFADDELRWAGPNGRNAEGFENLVAFQKRLRRDDLSLTHTLVNPTVDKATDRQMIGNPVPLHKVGETDDSIIVRGARLLATLAPYADETTVYPGAPLPDDPACNDYALSFTVSLDTPGLVFLCRDSGIRPDADPLDAPFSTRFDEQDAFCIFDDVEIPKSDVFIDGDIEIYNTVMRGSGWYPNVMQQTTTRALTKLEFAYALASQMAEAINDCSERTGELLGEILGYVEMTRSALFAAEDRFSTWESGAVYLDNRAIFPLRALLPDWFGRINEIFKMIGGHNLLSVASQGQMAEPRVAALVDEFLHGANDVSARHRTEIFRLAWDFMGSVVGTRGELYERNYLQSARSNRMTSHRAHSAAARARGDELVAKMLDDARSRRSG